MVWKWLVKAFRRVTKRLLNAFLVNRIEDSLPVIFSLTFHENLANSNKKKIYIYIKTLFIGSLDIFSLTLHIGRRGSRISNTPFAY